MVKYTDRRIPTALQDTVGRCLLEGTCDLQDSVDRYALALELMHSKRKDAVFDILEEMTSLNNAYQFEEAQTGTVVATTAKVSFEVVTDTPGLF